MHYYQFNIGDYKSHTSHLNHFEDLAYRRLLDLYYLHEKPLDNSIEAVARLIGMSDYVADVEMVLLEFFVCPERGGWKNSRADKEISDYKGFSDAGKRGAAKRWQTGGDSPPIAPPIANINHKTLTINHEPLESKPLVVAKAIDRVPYEEIVNLYHQILPKCPRCLMLTSKRKGQIAARWKSEALKDLAAWKDYFESAGESKFLMGLTDPTPGRKRFVADLEWLTNESNFIKLAEGKYHA